MRTRLAHQSALRRTASPQGEAYARKSAGGTVLPPALFVYAPDTKNPPRATRYYVEEGFPFLYMSGGK